MLERAIAIAEQDPDRAETSFVGLLADDEVELAITIEVTDCHADEFGARDVGEERGLESSVAIVKRDCHLYGGVIVVEDDVGFAVAVETANHNLWNVYGAAEVENPGRDKILRGSQSGQSEQRSDQQDTVSHRDLLIPNTAGA